MQTNELPEYELSLRRNQEGDEIVHFVHRSHLAHNHPRLVFPRAPMRRQTRGIFTESWKLNTLPDDYSGD
ncbi:MAG TPA: hypothetical protein VGG64_14315 [Pirellulales bacterium]|nr:hypothetical protein [Pirellulales bacterium]